MREDARHAISRLWRRSDFQRNPIRALGRRMCWRARWACTNKPWRVPMSGGGSIVTPKSGPGALIYYQGASAPEISGFLEGFLKPGMVFWDIGSHIGEYALLASQKVGNGGRVEAFEPHPRAIELLGLNIHSSQCSNVVLHPEAVANCAGYAELVLDSELSMSYLEPATPNPDASPRVRVHTTTLNRVHENCGHTPHLIKVDVEGTENLVLQGAGPLLQLPPEISPVWIMEFAPENCARYGYHPNQLLTEFHDYGYRSFWITNTGLTAARADQEPPDFSKNFVATKNESLLRGW